MRFSLSTDSSSNGDRGKLHRVVLGAESGRRQQQSENLRIGTRRPICEPIEQKEHQQTATQTAQELKVPAPTHIAKKNSFRSAPRIVSGRETERCTGWMR